MADVGGRDELPFLDVHDAAGAARGDEQVRLAAQERRDLQNVGGLGGGFRLRGFVDIGEDRESGSADGLEDPDAFGEPRSAIGGNAGAVGFVEGGFEDVRPRDLADLAGEEVGVVLAFDDAGSGDEGEGSPAAEGDLG